MMQYLVEVDDGVRLMINRTGTGSPPVVCLSAAGWAHDQWSEMVDRLSRHTEIITYGRPSLGGSDPLPTRLAGSYQTISWAAAQLRTLLYNAGIAPPYVLITSSIGAWIADQYTTRWPDEVAGLVLVDPSNLTRWPRIEETPTVDGEDEDEACIRLDADESYAELARSASSAPARCVVVSSSEDRWSRRPPNSRWYEPLTLAEVDLLWQAGQRDWVQRLSAQHVVADTAGHFVQRDQPDLVAHVVCAVLDAARRNRPVQLAAADVADWEGELRLPKP